MNKVLLITKSLCIIYNKATVADPAQNLTDFLVLKILAGGMEAKPQEALKIVQFSTLKKRQKIHSHGAFFCDP